MSIQGNINQILSQAGVMAGLVKRTYQESPGFKEKQEAQTQQEKFERAKGSIEDIHKNIVEEGKTYDPIEVENIRERLKEANKNIYDVKTAELGPLGKYIDTSSFRHKDIKPKYESIMSRLGTMAQGKVDQKERLEDLKNLIKTKANVSGKQVRETMHVLRRAFGEDVDGTK